MKLTASPPPLPPPPPYRLADHVRACAVGTDVVLLDLKRSRYLGIGARQCQALNGVIEDWPSRAFGANAPWAGADVKKFLEPLLAQRLVTERAEKDRRPMPSVEEATASMDVGAALPDAHIAARHLCGFIAATALSALSLRYCSLQTIADRVAVRRGRPSGDAMHPTSLDRLQTSVSAFESLRPLLLTARDQCLYDSLALLTFLARQKIFPRWVVGVSTHPFRAHSWVQEGHVVLNDLHENVRQFTPILVV